MTLGRPASIAIHDDGDVTWNRAALDKTQLRQFGASLPLGSAGATIYGARDRRNQVLDSSLCHALPWFLTGGRSATIRSFTDGGASAYRRRWQAQSAPQQRGQLHRDDFLLFRLPSFLQFRDIAVGDLLQAFNAALQIVSANLLVFLLLFTSVLGERWQGQTNHLTIIRRVQSQIALL